MMSREEMHSLVVEAITEALREHARSDLVEVPILYSALPGSAGTSITINRKAVLLIERVQETITRVVMQDHSTMSVAWTYNFTVRQLS